MIQLRLDALSKITVKVFMSLFACLGLVGAQTKGATSNQGISNAETSSVENNINIENGSRAVFSQLMNNPFLHQTFHEAQLSHLTDEVDRSIINFLTKTPELIEFYNLILNNQTKSLNFFTASANINMFKITDDNDKIQNKDAIKIRDSYENFDKIIKETARALGFSEEAILNRNVYIANGQGALNAFTVSGSQDKIIVVVNTEILDKMTEMEVRAVLAHEMGHIRARHTVNQYALNILYKMLFEYLAGEKTTSTKNFETLLDKLNPHMIADIHKKKIYMNPLETQMAQYESQLIMEAQKAILRLPQQEILNLFHKFLSLNVEILKLKQAPLATINYFKTLQGRLQNATSPLLHPNEFKNHLEITLGLISPSQEITSDRFASSVSSNQNMASAIAKLLGVPFKKEKRDFILEKIVQQALDYYKLMPEEFKPYFESGSHPPPILRAFKILNLSKTPEIFFANPFIRILIIERELYKTQLIVDKIMKENGDQLNEMKDVLNKEIEKLNQNLVLVTKTISNLVLEVEPKLLKSNRNPRFDNLIQYLLFHKEQSFRTYQEVTSEIQKISNEETTNQLSKALKEERVQQLTSALEELKKDIQLGDRLLSQLNEAYNKYLLEKGLTTHVKRNIAQRIEQITTASSTELSDANLKKLQNLRASLTEYSGIRKAGPRIPVSCRTVFN